MRSNMKYALYALFLGLVVAGFAACKKSSTSPSGTSGTGKTFYCKLNGKEFETANGRFYKTPIGDGSIQIVGDTTFTTIEIYLPKPDAGTYALKNTVPEQGTVFINDGSKLYKSESGEVKVTKSDGSTMSGTFKYTAKSTAGETMEVTEGEFNNIPLKP